MEKGGIRGTMKAFGYVRVFENDVEDADDLEGQKAFIREYAADQGMEIARFFEDGYANTEDFPPGFKSMMAHLNGVRTVIVQDLDRLALRPDLRTLMITELQSQDVTLICAATDEYVTEGSSE